MVHNRRILRLVLSVAGLVLDLSVLNVRKCNLITVLVKWPYPIQDIFNECNLTQLVQAILFYEKTYSSYTTIQQQLLL